MVTALLVPAVRLNEEGATVISMVATECQDLINRKVVEMLGVRHSRLEGHRHQALLYGAM